MTDDNETVTTWDSIRPVNGREFPYPVTITESRYGGAYCGGQWILTAGVFRPRQVIDAWGDDGECGVFWREHHTHGPEIEAEGLANRDTCYVAAGDNPEKLFRDCIEYYEDDD